MRSKIIVPINADKLSVQKCATQDYKVKKYLQGTIRKVIYIPNKLLNIVIDY